MGLFVSSLLSPVFKWTGGKRRELSVIEKFYPSFVKDGSSYRFVEPFVGGGAVFWALNNTAGVNVVNDFDAELANFYKQMKAQDDVFLKHVEEASALYGADKRDDVWHKKQEANYYHWRNLDRDGGISKLSDAERAARFWIVNQLAFSGMRRFNSKGEFNVPYGHYKNLNSSLLTEKEHVDLLAKTTVLNGDYKQVVLNNDVDDCFMFVDPPYTRVMKTYSASNEFGEDSQRELADTLKGLKKAKWMVVIDKSDLTLELYSSFIVHTYELSYGVNIKNRFSTKVEHIIATNY